MGKYILNLNGPRLNLPTSIKQASFDYVSRYQLIAEIITRYFEADKALPRNILDVGGLGSFLAQIIGTPITIFDNEAKEGESDQTKGDGAHMSDITDGTYDVVVTSDTLEHIPQKDRKDFINEIIRVSNDLVILCAPFDDHGAAEEEAKLQQYYKRITGQPHRWLREHAEIGLPNEKGILSYFNQHKDLSTVIMNHSSLELWREILATNLLANDMGVKSVHKSLGQINSFYNRELLFKDFTANSYRSFFIASKKRQLAYQIPKDKPSSKDYLQLTQLLSEFYMQVAVAARALPNIKQMTEEHERAKHKIAQLEGELHNLSEEHKNLVNSKSWRYTAPLRKARTNLKH